MEFRPGNKTIYVVFDEESEFSGPRKPKLRPDQVFEDNVPYKNLFLNLFFLLISFFSNPFRGLLIAAPLGKF